MRTASVFCWAATASALVVFVLGSPTQPAPQPKTFLLDHLGKGGFTISRITTEDQVQPQQYSVRFVPLISLLFSFFPNLVNRFGQFGNVNKIANTRRFDVADKLEEGATTMTPGGEKEQDEGEEGESTEAEETELIECNGAHLGLWPDPADSQRYYKCEVDPRTPAHASCVRDMYKQVTGDNTAKEMVPLEKIQVPGVRPCFLLSMLKCANGFKYHHRTRICVPDIIFATAV